MKEPVGRQPKTLSSEALSPSFNPQQTYNLDSVFFLFSVVPREVYNKL